MYLKGLVVGLSWRSPVCRRWSLRRKIRQRSIVSSRDCSRTDPAIGSFTRTARPDLDFVVIDAQYGTFDIGPIRQILGGLRVGDGPPAVTPIVRIPYVARDAPHAVVKQLLAVGVFGVMFPDIETRDQAITAIGSMRFAQAPGARDSEPAGLRAAGSGSAPRYWRLSENDYDDRADLWPLDPDGQLVAMLPDRIAGWDRASR